METFKTHLIQGARSAAPLIVCMLLCAVCAFAQDPISNAGTKVSASTLFAVRAVGVALIAICGGSFLLNDQHAVGPRIVGVIIGGFVLYGAAPLANYMQNLSA